MRQHMENGIEDKDSKNLGEDTDSENGESVEDLKKKNQELYEQLKKAKGFVRNENGEWVKKEPKVEPKLEPETKPEVKTSTMSETDMLAVVRADVDDQDLEYVKKYATLEGISISEALKSPELKEILKTKQEVRKTAEATNVGASRKPALKVSDETLLEKASKGDLPESDAELERLAKLRIQQKKSKA